MRLITSSSQLETVGIRVVSASPTLTSVSPDKGSTKGKTLLTIKETNFFSNLTQVKVGGKQAQDMGYNRLIN